MRCYNGCPDSQLQAVLDRGTNARKLLQEKIPGAHCTYFPVEQRFQVYNNYKPISGMCYSAEAAINEAISTKVA